jgi:pyruvate ferredoxin oxidoreductase gamma subunit
MFSIRIHGRGGQGVVTAAELLSVAVHTSGRHAQAFPSFGSERTGAPVVAFCRVDDRPIRLREPVLRPDALIIQDATLLQAGGVFSGLAAGGYVLVNAPVPLDQLRLPAAIAALGDGHLAVIPASRLAKIHIGRPLPNAALLGGLAALTGLVPIDAVAQAIRGRFPTTVAQANIAAAVAAYELVDRSLPVRGASEGRHG